MSSPHRKVNIVEPISYFLKDDGSIPNSSLPLLVYGKALRPKEDDPASVAEAIFSSNLWTGLWRDGIFSYHHYHSTAHEVLGTCRGGAKVQFGGEKGPGLTVEAGDVVVIPAGGGHRNLSSSSDLLVVGGYPPGTRPDLLRNEPEEREVAVANIKQVPLSERDPLLW